MMANKSASDLQGYNQWLAPGGQAPAAFKLADSESAASTRRAGSDHDVARLGRACRAAVGLLT